MAQVVQVTFALLVIVFISIYLLRIDWASLSSLQLAWIPFTLATAVALGYRAWGAFIWLFLLERLGAGTIRHHVVELGYVYAKAWLGRYLLGAGTWILGKVYFAAQHGIGKRKLAISGLLEGGLQLLATLVVGLVLLLVDPRLGTLGNEVVALSVVALVACLIALLPPVFRTCVRLTLRALRRAAPPPEDLPDASMILRGGLLYLVGTLITGVSYFLIARAVYADLAWADLPYVVGAASVAAAVSLLAVFAPGGIGVREGVQVLFFSALMPVEVAVVVTVLMRLWSLGVDVLFFGLTAVVRRRRLRTERAQQQG